MKTLHKKMVLLAAVAMLFFMSGTANSKEEPTTPEPLPYFEDLMTDWEIEEYGYKYRPLFDNPRILNAMRTRDRVPYVDWDSDLQLRLLRAIFTYDACDGNIHIYPDHTEYSERFMQDRMPDFEMGKMGGLSIEVQYMRFNDEYEEYLMINHMAWHLFIEANYLVPWSITDLSDEALSVLFEWDYTQPSLKKQFYVVNVHPSESFAIINGSDREDFDMRESLIGATVLETILNVIRFVGERSVHIRDIEHGRPSHVYYIDDPEWPYWARDLWTDEPLPDGDGEYVPLDRLPTPREILINRHPHRNTSHYQYRARKHIIPGCWGASKLMKSLLSSINIPVKLMGNYMQFKGHSGLSFPEVDGDTYNIHHSDNIYAVNSFNGLKDTTEHVEGGDEMWSDPSIPPGFSPMGDFIGGYSILHQNISAGSMTSLGISEEDQEIMIDELGPVYTSRANDVYPEERRLLALRAMSAPLPINLLYKRCMTRSSDLLPDFVLRANLTDAEETEFLRILDEELAMRGVFGRDDRYVLFALEMQTLYQKKTGLFWYGDADADGVMNHQDRYPYIDVEPVPEDEVADDFSESAFRSAIEF